MTGSLFTQIVTVLVSLLLPFILEKANEYYKLNGNKALALAGIASAIIAIGIGLVTGDLVLSDFTLDNFAPIFTEVFALTTVVYNLVKDKLRWTGK